jgi:hypothetical protein
LYEPVARVTAFASETHLGRPVFDFSTGESEILVIGRSEPMNL